jgi:hypothetical protein
MIVSLEELKRVLGLDLEDTSEDDNLTRIIQAKTVWVQGETRRRFDTPILTTEYHEGSGEQELILFGHVDDSVAADNPSESLDPTTSVKVWRRPLMERFREWEPLIEGDDWERREQTLIMLRGWNVWERVDEFKVEYRDGYVVAPEDIKEVILEMAMNQYFGDVETSSGMAGITSEKIGDYSYSAGSGGSSSLVGMNSLTDNSTKTLQRYKRKFA